MYVCDSWIDYTFVAYLFVTIKWIAIQDIYSMSQKTLETFTKISRFNYIFKEWINDILILSWYWMDLF